MQSENKLLTDCGSASGRAPLWAVLTWPFRKVAEWFWRQMDPR